MTSQATKPAARRGLLRASGLYGIATLSRSVTGLAVLPVLVAVLSPDEFGLVMLLTPLWWICQSVLSWGASDGLVRAVSSVESRVAAGAVVLSAVVVIPMTALLAAVLSVGSDALLGVAFGSTIAAGVIAAGLQSYMSCTLGMLQGQLQSGRATVVLFAFAFLPPLAGLAVLGAWEQTSFAYVAGYTGGLAAVVVIGLLAMLRIDGAVISREARAVLVDSCKVGLPLTPQLVTVQFVDIATRRLVLSFAGLAGVGAYGLAAACGNLMWNLIKSASQAWSPRLFTLEDHQTTDYVRRTYAYGIPGSLVCMAMGLALLPVVGAFLPNDYDSTAFEAAAAVFLASATTGVGFVVASGLCFRARRTVVLAWLTPLLGALSLLVAVLLAHGLYWPAAAVASPFLYALSMPGILALMGEAGAPHHRLAYWGSGVALLGGLAGCWAAHHTLTSYYVVVALFLLATAAIALRCVASLRVEHHVQP